MKIGQLRKYEKLQIKMRKAELEVTFLTNYQTYNVTPKLLAIDLPNVSSYNLHFIKKRLLRSAVNIRNKVLRSYKRYLLNQEWEIGRAFSLPIS